MAMLYPATSGATAAYPTRHLRLEWSTGGRRSRTINTQSLKTYLSNFGAIHDFLLLGDKGKAFVSFMSADEAQKAFSAVHEQMISDFSFLKFFAAFVDAEGAAATLQQKASAALLLAGASANTALEAAALIDAAAVQLRMTKPPAASMRTLPGIPGLILIHDFLSEEEESALITAIDAAEWTPQLSRRVQHYGHAFDYRTRKAVTDSTTLEPGVAPPPTRAMLGPIARVADTLAVHGFIGDSGDARLNSLVLKAPVKTLQGLLDALGTGCNTFVPSASEYGASIHSHSDILQHSSGQIPHGGDAGTNSSVHAFPQIDQATVNEYMPGRGISAHVDTHQAFQDGVVSVSILDDIVMEFSWAVPGDSRYYATTEEEYAIRSKTHYLVLPRRSLLLIRGEARYAWSHRIPARTTDLVEQVRKERSRRLSITYRSVRRQPCTCPWPRACFDQEGGSSEPSELYSPRLIQERLKAQAGQGDGGCDVPVPALEAQAPQPPAEQGSSAGPSDSQAPASFTPALEATFVHAVYDAIAPHFSATRHSPWPRVEAYLRSLPVGTIVLDVGCGNGKYMGSAPPGRLAITGCDRSEPLVQIAGSKGHEVCVGDAVVQPYRRGCADVAMAIALLHHLSTRSRRVAVLKGLLQNIRRGGHVLVYVWAQEQGTESKRLFGQQDILVPWCLQKRFFEGPAAGSATEPGAGPVPGSLDALTSIGGTVDEARQAVVVQRYCHVYSAGEIESLCAEAAAELGAAWAISDVVQARAVEEQNQSARSANVAEGPAPAAQLPISARPGDAVEAPIATAASIPDAAVEPARGTRTKKGKLLAEPSELDAITARLVSQAASLQTEGSPPGQPRTVTALDLWWERDNWCILLKAD